MRLTLLRRAACVAALGALALPASSLGVVRIVEDNHGANDIDVRVGKVAPTAAQKAAAKRLHAKVTWNRFGTPETVSKRGKYLAKGIRGKNAPEAARRWLHRNRALFGLASTSGLELAGDSPMVSSRGHAVNFRQVANGLETTEGGLITIGLTRAKKSKRWNVAYVSSSITRNTAVDGRAKLSGVQAWLKAAGASGLHGYSIANVKSAKRTAGWTQLAVGGLGQAQATRPVLFPTIRSGLVPSFETIVVKAKDALGFKVVIDARTGAVLARANLVQNLESKKEATKASEAYSFSGELAATEGACNTHTFSIAAGNRALDGFAAATNPLNDLVLELYKGTTLLMHADTLNSPESFHYEPAGGVPAGADYSIKVCDFDAPTNNDPWATPRTYTATVNGDASPAPPAYLARWKVFPNSPPLHTIDGFPWNHPDTDTRETWCWVSAPGCDRIVPGPLSFRGPWDHDHKTNAPTLTTRGNNAKSATSWTDPLLPSPPQYSPVAANRDYSFPWTNDWNNRQCNIDPGPAVWDQDAAAVNLFVAHNRMHDWAYYLGFTERNFNAQDYNFGLTERRQENDPIIGNVQAGALPPAKARDNANMITLPDGQPSITNMYFWQPAAGGFYAPCVDGDYDMSVIGHEYGHMIENRMIGKGNVRSGHHAGAMGESHGDMFGMEYLNGNVFGPTSDENPFASGPYDTGNKLRAIRNFGMNFPTSGGVPKPGKQLNINTLNFADMGYDLTGPTFTSSSQVHANGEIFSKTNFVIRSLLVEKYNDDFPYDDEDLQYACANGELPPYACPGNRRWIQLLFDAMLLMPTNPTMLQARDATLAADLMRFGGANQRELWLGYARQGMGVGATTMGGPVALPVPPPPAPPPNPPCSPCGTLDETDTDPSPSYESPLHDNGTITFAAVNKNGDPVTTARFYVGHFEARVSPIADTNPATTGANLDNVARMAPGTYEFTVNAQGYGFFRFRKTVHRGESSTFTVRLAQNVASANAGAVATGDTNGTTPAAQAATLRALIDDTENTQWETPGNATGPLTVDGKKVTIDLAGTKPVHVRSVQVSAMLRSGQSRFSALRQFEVWACNSDRDNCSTDAGFTKVYASGADAFPGNAPRPVSPNLILRSFDIPNTKSTHLRFVVKTNQCTGGPNFLGEQDADPANATDCPTAGAAPTKIVRAAEFQAFEHETRLHGKRGRHGKH